MNTPSRKSAAAVPFDLVMEILRDAGDHLGRMMAEHPYCDHVHVVKAYGDVRRSMHGYVREPAAEPSQSGSAGEAIYLVCTGEVYEGQETYTRHDRAPQMCDFETLYATPTTSTTGKVDASRVLAPDIPPGCEMARGWCVEVSAQGERVLLLSDVGYSGLADIEPWASTIRGCAEHLQAFIGPAEGSASFDPDEQLETGEDEAIEPKGGGQ